MKKQTLTILLALGAALALAGCNDAKKDDWWNANTFAEGSFYLTTVDGTNSTSLKFDTSSYFTLTAFKGTAEAQSYVKGVRQSAPNGLWYAPDDNSSDLKMEWSNCYLATMPSFSHSGWTDSGQRFAPFYMIQKEDGSYAKTKWAEDYPDCYQKEDGTSADGIKALFTLHAENGSLSAVKLHFTIEGVCDLTMLFSKS